MSLFALFPVLLATALCLAVALALSRALFYQLDLEIERVLERRPKSNRDARCPVPAAVTPSAPLQHGACERGAWTW
jgi:hypothetical protein